MPLSDAAITKKVGELRKTQGKIYAPLKYFRGASPQAWGYARVHSFATRGKTYYTADADLRKN